MAAQNNWKPARFEPEAIEALCGYRWPGNVRELRNIVERLLLLAEGPVDAATVALALPLSATQALSGASEIAGPLAERVAEFERVTIQQELKRHGNHMTNTAARDWSEATSTRSASNWGLRSTATDSSVALGRAGFAFGFSPAKFASPPRIVKAALLLGRLGNYRRHRKFAPMPVYGNKGEVGGADMVALSGEVAFHKHLDANFHRGAVNPVHRDLKITRSPMRTGIRKSRWSVEAVTT